MPNTLSKTGIVDNSTVRTWHVTQSIDAFTGIKAYDITLSGSLVIDGYTNLTLPVTGNTLTSAQYAVSSSDSTTGLSASLASSADVSRDTFFFQLHHGTFKTPRSQSAYFFAVNPLIGNGDSIPSSSAYVGTNYPQIFTVVSASITSTVNGTLATGSFTNSGYILWVSGTPYSFSHTPNMSSSIYSFREAVDLPYDGHEIYVEWRTGDWTTGPAYVTHNVVLYCDRGYDPA